MDVEEGTHHKQQEDAEDKTAVQEEEEDMDEEQKMKPTKNSLQMLQNEESIDSNLENEESKIMRESMGMSSDKSLLATGTHLISADSFDRFKWKKYSHIMI